jgi:hypothetical protein
MEEDYYMRQQRKADAAFEYIFYVGVVLFFVVILLQLFS